MEGEEESVKMIQEAIRRLIAENREDGALSDCQVGTDGDDRLSLSRILSQLELHNDGTQQHSPASISETSLSEFAEAGEACINDETERITRPTVANEVLRELKNMKKQNRITHWLLSAMIVLTTIWQLSEVSILLIVKQKLTHPFKAFGGLILGAFKRRLVEADQRKTSEKNTTSKVLPLFGKLPEPPSVDISSLVADSSGEQ